MQSNNSGLINFEVKTSPETFFIINSVLYVQILFLDVVNMVSREVLECHVGYCNHGATWGI